jgi:ABC-type branched-subunit amino acid transport system substrate-binding protein
MKSVKNPEGVGGALHRARPLALGLALAVSLTACGGSTRSASEFAQAAGANAQQSPSAAAEAPTGTAGAAPDTTSAQAAGVPAPTSDGGVPTSAVGKTATATNKSHGAAETAKASGHAAKDVGAPSTTKTATKPAGAGSSAKNASAAPTSCVKPAGKPVLLGNVGDYAGVMGDDFAPGLQSIQLFVRQLNDCNGLNGHPVQLFNADDQGDPAVALTEAKDMVQNKKVIAFVGNFVFLSWSGIVSYLDSVGIPMIGGDSYTDIWYQKAMAFPTHTNIQTQIAAVVRASTPKGQAFNGATIYCSEQPICESYAKSGAKAMQDNGGKIVAEQSVSLTQPSYIAQCSTEKANKAEYVVSALVPADVERWARNCDSIGYKPHRLTLALGAKDSHKSVPNLDHMDIGLGEFPWTDTQLPGEKAFHEAIAKYNPRMTLAGSSSIGWVAGLVLQEAAKALGDTPTTKDLLQGLYQIKNEDFGGLSPKISYKPGVHPSDSFPSCAFLMEIQNSEWVATHGGKCV